MLTLNIYCDGGSRGNPGPAASAFIIKDRAGKIIFKGGKFLGKATNNIAEYQAVIEALEWLKRKFSHQSLSSSQLIINFYLDSRLVVNQLNGYFKIKEAKLRELIIKIKILEREVKGRIYYQLIPRQENWPADKLVNQILDAST